MQERAALVGASLEIESTPGKGTTILVRMAVPAGAASMVIMPDKRRGRCASCWPTITSPCGTG